MTSNPCRCGNTTCRVPYGLCHCGCGTATRIAPQSASERGWVKGEPIFFVRGHAQGRRYDRHELSGIDERNRRAVCSHCGPVTIKAEKALRAGWKCTRRIVTEHALTEQDFEDRKAWCRGCQARVSIVPKGKGKWRCAKAERITNDAYRAKDGVVENKARYAREWNAKNGRAWRMERTFGITVEDYDKMLADQGGICAICGGPPRGSGGANGFFHVDHCHDTGAVRGLLCGPCNVGIGALGDDIKRVARALEYLRRAQQPGG